MTSPLILDFPASRTVSQYISASDLCYSSTKVVKIAQREETYRSTQGQKSSGQSSEVKSKRFFNIP
jgi:hypothetical protein